MADLSRLEVIFLDRPNGILGRNAPLEAEELPLPLADLVSGDGELLLHQIGIDPVVLAALDAVAEDEIRTDGHELVAGLLHHHPFRSCGQELNLELTGKDPANLVFATGFSDQSIEFTDRQIFGCETGHDHLHWASVPTRIISSPGDTGL